jgi:chromosome segregation ATPase
LSAQLSTQLVEADGLRESLAEICASQEEFGRFFAGVFAELDALSAKLVRRSQAWQSHATETESELQQRSDRLNTERAAIAAEREEAWKEIQEKRRQLEHEHPQVAAAGAGDNGQLQRMLEEAERDRTALRTALEDAQKQSERLAQVADEFSHTRAELAEARRELERLRNGLDHGADPAQAQPDQKAQEQLQVLQQERAQLDQERVVLETELDMVRNRAAETAEALAQQQRQMADERQQWAQELKRMRRLLEGLAGRALDHPPAARPQRTMVEPRRTNGTSPDEPCAPRANGDPVLGSVMAQFEMLQKDIVRRRRESAESTVS